MIKVVLVDDQPLVRAGLHRILSEVDGLTIVADCGDGAAALAALETTPADVVLMDVRMRSVDGVTATRRIRELEGPPVLVLTTFDDDEVLWGTIDAGAAGFVLKEASAEDLIAATRTVAEGGAWLDPAVTGRVLEVTRSRGLPRRREAERAGLLTEREAEVLRHMATGATNAEVAGALFVSETTVRTHVGSIFAKLGVRDRAGAIVFAYQHGLVSPTEWDLVSTPGLTKVSTVARCARRRPPSSWASWREVLAREVRRMESPVVELRGLCKSYDDRLVVDHVDLDVHEGEIVGLLGANGAGKTTTVECISGLRRPDAGSVRVLGIDPQVDGGRLRSLVGSQLQESALPDRLRVAEAVELFRGPRAMPAEGLLQAFGLAEHRNRTFSALSGGQRQRLFLVLALLNRPRLVILDELTQGLDPAARRDVWDAVRSVRDAGTTALLVTHYMDEAEALCDRVVVMDRGWVLDAGPPAEPVDRNAPWATVRFSARGPVDGGLDVLDGVHAVRSAGSSVEVHGDRRMIAQVCAYLVATGDVPDDLTVVMPTLEHAVLDLLARAEREPKRSGGSQRPGGQRTFEPIGGTR